MTPLRGLISSTGQRAENHRRACFLPSAARTPVERFRFPEEVDADAAGRLGVDPYEVHRQGADRLRSEPRLAQHRIVNLTEDSDQRVCRLATVRLAEVREIGRLDSRMRGEDLAQELDQPMGILGRLPQD